MVKKGKIPGKTPSLGKNTMLEKGKGHKKQQQVSKGSCYLGKDGH